MTDDMARFESIAKGVEDMRESLRAMTAGLQADGFDEEQARDIVAGFFRMVGKGESETP